MRQFYASRLAIRNVFNPLLNAGKLFHQYAVDAYVKIESNNLNFIRFRQNQLRVELYQGLMDYINSNSAPEGPPGRLVILPSSFSGSPRNMQQRYQDAMAIVRKYGKPDLFITMTCNPKWREVSENLNQNNKREHRPDLIARVFQLKLKGLLDDLLNKNIFGKVVAKVYVIEFQKRGLPHAHILIVLEEGDKPTTPEKVDSIVSAELPDPVANPRLFEIVISNMIHTPCGKGTNLSCMDNEVCRKRFPKPFQSETLVNVGGYPSYRRRDGSTYFHNGKAIDNSWVVPYNPFLCLKFNCHINVEICASFKSVKYLFKYIYKGHDCANLVISEKNAHDEVDTYLDTRFVSAPEACWRIFAFQMHEQSHTIVRLSVHLPNHQNVYFLPNEEMQAAQRSETHDTTLTAWFRLNQSDVNARQYLYFQIPEHFRFKNYLWQPRVNNADKVIGRMYVVSPLDSERYFLRLLLLHVAGAQSFEGIRTVNGVIFNSFREAAMEMGLLERDDVWDLTLSEAALTHMPRSLRQLFAFILVLNNPTDPLVLWQKYLEYMVEDFCNMYGHEFGHCTICEDRALNDLNETLSMYGKSSSDFGLPTPGQCIPSEVSRDDENRERMTAQILKSSLTLEQRVVFEEVMSAVASPTPVPKCFFLDGPGGSGKTYLYKTFTSELRGASAIVVPTASTGIAANLIVGGRTVHSQFKIPIPVNETTVSRIVLNSKEAKYLRNAKLIIVDEATMILHHVLNVVDSILQQIMGNTLPFGGKTFLLGGDFRQCLPVVPHGAPSAIIQSCIKYSNNWGYFKRLSLKENKRSSDPVYSEWLLKMGDGKLQNERLLGEEIIQIPTNYISTNLVLDVYGDKMVASDYSSFARKAILCPKNEDVDELNDQVISILEGRIKTYFSIDKIECEDKEEEQNFPMEFVNSLTPSGMPPHLLRLKIGAIVMLQRNLNTNRGLCNGTRLTVTGMHENVLEARVLTGSAEGAHVLIPRISLSPSNDELPFKLERRQFPIKLAFAMTINKSQGQTMEKVGIFLREPVFSHGQLYVAFSRVRSSNDVKIQICETNQQGKLVEDSDEVFTKNVVFSEVFMATN